MKTILGVILFSSLLLELTGCASIGRTWKGLVSDEPEKDSSAKPGTNSDGSANNSAGGSNGVGGMNNSAFTNANGISFNSNPNFGNYQDRQYKRVTKQNFEENQNLEESAGSLWKKEGQGSYLFAQNNLRVMGDVINVEVDGRVSENLNSKVANIKKTLNKFETAPRPIMAPRPVARVPSPEGERDLASAKPRPQEIQQPQPVAPAAEVAKVDDKKDAVKFDPVTCRIVEKNSDGSYRIKGLQSVIIGRKEYKLIVTGIVRGDDINTDTIAASKILESKFDLVATNREVEK